MKGFAQRPLLFLDVDGPLIPFGAAQQYPVCTWVSTHHPGQALLHRVDARMGLTKGDYVVLDEWLRGTHEMLTSATCR